MIKGTTESGFEFEISDETLNDWELTEALAELQENQFAVVKVSKLLLRDNDQYNKLKEHVKVNGRIDQNKMSDEVLQIFKSSQQTKN